MVRSPVRVVLFDLGGTLIDNRNLDGWAELARRWGIDVDASHLAHAYDEVTRDFDHPPPVPPFHRWWAEVLSRASGGPVSPEVGEAFVAAARELPPVSQLFSDTRRCLHDLSGARRRLGVVSNSRSEGSSRDLLRRAGIDGFFETVVSSGTEGVAKPDREIFERALARMGISAAEAFFIGDLAFTDAKAANLAGIRSVWLRRDGTGFGSDPPEITSLTELPGYLRRLEAGGTP